MLYLSNFMLCVELDIKIPTAGKIFIELNLWSG